MTRESANDIESLCKDFWKQFRQYLKNTNSTLYVLGSMDIRDQVFFDILDHGKILSKVLMGETVKKGLYVELLLEKTGDAEANKKVFKLLHDEKDDIERDLGLSLEWDEELNKELEKRETIRAKIYFYNPCNPRDPNNWAEQHKWVEETVIKFNTAFTQRLTRIMRA